MYPITRTINHPSGSEPRIQPADIHPIARYRKLYGICFPQAYHLDHAYLEWLYFGNPCGNAMGAEAVDGEDIVGQVVGIPGEFCLKGEHVRGLIAVNVAVHPNYQGRHLFKKMGLFMCDLARTRGFSFVMGVANKAATPGWIRQMRFQLVAPLEARIGVGPNWMSSLGGQRRDEIELYRVWDTESLAWRISNPVNPVHLVNDKDKYRAYSRSSHPLVTAYCEFTGPSMAPESQPPGFIEKLLPRISLGLNPDNQVLRGAYMDLPERLRPSPLNLIFKSLMDPTEKINESKCLITSLDFDAF
jgi:hypothetical protein